MKCEGAPAGPFCFPGEPGSLRHRFSFFCCPFWQTHCAWRLSTSQDSCRCCQFWVLISLKISFLVSWWLLIACNWGRAESPSSLSYSTALVTIVGTGTPRSRSAAINTILCLKPPEKRYARGANRIQHWITDRKQLQPWLHLNAYVVSPRGKTQSPREAQTVQKPVLTETHWQYLW